MYTDRPYMRNFPHGKYRYTFTLTIIWICTISKNDASTVDSEWRPKSWRDSRIVIDDFRQGYTFIAQVSLTIVIC